jgi:hypothetical protein
MKQRNRITSDAIPESRTPDEWTQNRDKNDVRGEAKEPRKKASTEGTVSS